VAKKNRTKRRSANPAVMVAVGRGLSGQRGADGRPPFAVGCHTELAAVPVNFWCDLSQQGTELVHCWEHTVGGCHAPIALRADWQQQLRRCQAELGFRYVRFHGLLSDDVGTVIKHNDELLYSFFNADQIVDFLLSIGMKPLVELSFMPTRSRPDPRPSSITRAT
jgi:Glycosyl hydrolases family 39